MGTITLTNRIYGYYSFYDEHGSTITGYGCNYSYIWIIF